MSMNENDGGILLPRGLAERVQASVPQIVIKEASAGEYRLETNIPDRNIVIGVMLDLVKVLASQKQKPELIAKPNLMVAPN